METNEELKQETGTEGKEQTINVALIPIPWRLVQDRDMREASWEDQGTWEPMAEQGARGAHGGTGSPGGHGLTRSLRSHGGIDRPGCHGRARSPGSHGGSGSSESHGGSASEAAAPAPMAGTLEPPQKRSLREITGSEIPP